MQKAETLVQCRVETFETPRTIMRAPCLEGFHGCTRMWADKRVVRYITGGRFTQAESRSRLVRYIGHWQALDYGYFFVESEETGAFLGEDGFADNKCSMKPSLAGVPEIGWVLASHAHGCGLARETPH